MANFEYIESTGTVLPDTSAVQTEVENEYKAQFGEDLVVTPDTPQGMLIAVETAARIAFLQNMASLANQINPNLAGGIFLDAIYALTGGERAQAAFTVVFCTITGVVGTIVPAGSLAKLSTGEQFQTATEVTIPAGGTLTNVEFIAVESGAINVAPGTLTQIVSGVLGWETVTNPAAGTPGGTTPSDLQTRALRRVTLALQGMSLSEAIVSALNAVNDVRSVGYRENYTSSPVTIDTKELVANSIYVVVDGGLDQDVADTLRIKKTGGTNWNGDETINSTDPVSGQVYAVKFDRPTIVHVLIKVTVTLESGVQDPTETIKDAVLNYANSMVPGEEGFKIGKSVSCFEIAAAVNLQVPNLFIHKVEVSLDDPVDYSTNEIPIKFFEKAETALSSITVVIS